MIPITPYLATNKGGKLITSAARYAVKAMLDLATHAGEARVTTREISERQRIPKPFLTKIIERLIHAGLVVSQRGTRGGLALSKPAHGITFLEIVEAIDGSITRTPCFVRPDECICNRRCPIYEAWDVMQNNFVELLKNHTLDSVGCVKKPVRGQASRGLVNV